MARPRTRIGSELLPVFLILCCLAGTCTLVVSMHRRAAVARKEAARKPAISVARVAAPPRPVAVAPAPAPRPVVEAPPPRPEPDPTRMALARLGAAEAEQILEAQAADRRADGLERARLAALAESERWRRRERLIRDQIDAVAERAKAIHVEADALA